MGSSGSDGLLLKAKNRLWSKQACTRRVLKCTGRGRAAGVLPAGAAPLRPHLALFLLVVSLWASRLGFLASLGDVIPVGW